MRDLAEATAVWAPNYGGCSSGGVLSNRTSIEREPAFRAPQLTLCCFHHQPRPQVPLLRPARPAGSAAASVSQSACLLQTMFVTFNLTCLIVGECLVRQNRAWQSAPAKAAPREALEKKGFPDCRGSEPAVPDHKNQGSVACLKLFPTYD